MTKGCIILCLREYFIRHANKENLSSKKLIITLRKPYKGASIVAMHRWIKVIFLSNFNTADSSAHSCQVASTSNAKQLEISVDDIFQKGYWENCKNFFMY